jgi:hypothetical protein
MSLLTSFSKVIEKALYNRLIDYVNNNKILNPQQFGFRKNLATDDAIFNLTQEILNALNNKKLVVSIFFDLVKAFYSVNHSLPIQKLHHYGVTGKAKLLLESYLIDFKQYNWITPPQIIKLPLCGSGVLSWGVNTYAR